MRDFFAHLNILSEYVGHGLGVEPDVIALGFQELVELSPQQIVSRVVCFRFILTLWLNHLL